MLPILFILSLFHLKYILGENTEVNIAQCKTTFTLGYGYKKMYHIREAGEHSDNHLIFKFYVKAPSDAHVLLSGNDNPTSSDPTYEIVIGGGRNSFSAIRSNSKSTAAHVSTLNILSPDEYRGFWIKLSPLGHLEVGKTGSEAPFIFWDDLHPVTIRFFGFSNWASYVGQWAYSCPNETQANEVPANLTTLEKLRKHLLTYYDPYNRPVIQTTDITTVYIQLQNKVVKLNEKKSKMFVMADVYMQWHDQKLLWNPAQHGNISKLTMAYHEIWQPELILFNAVGSSTGFLVDEIMNVSPIGSVKWKSHIEVEVHCNLDLSEWPYDTQKCELQLGFSSEQAYLQLIKANELQENRQLTNSEWEITSLYYKNIFIKTPWTNASFISQEAAMAIRYILKRNNYMYRAVFGVPLLAISIMTLLPFWISPINPIKLHISCLSLVIMTLFVITLAQILPAPADHTPVLVQTYSRGMVAVTFSILISIAVITMTHCNSELQVPRLVKNILTGKCMKFVFFLSAIPHEETSDYGHLLETDDSDQQGDISSNSCEKPNPKENWILMAQLIDRLSFIVYFVYVSTVFFSQL